MPQCCNIIAHRGYARHYPENTLAAFRAALDAGADAVELDVQFAADGTPMVIHDAETSRVSDQKGFVAQLNASELGRIRVHEPNRFGQRFQNETMPTLKAACRFLADYPAPLVFIEVKEETLALHKLPALIQRVIHDSDSLDGRRVIISFLEGVVQQASSVGQMPVGWVLSRYDTASMERAYTLEPEYLFCNRTRLPVGDGELPQGSWEWAIYEVTNPEEARRLYKRGVNYIETMAVQTLREGLSEQRGPSS